MSESLRNDGRIWVPKDPDDDPLARPDPRGGARLLPRAEVPELRQPRAPRRRVPQRQDDGRRGQGRRPAARTACTSTSATPSSRLGASTSSTSATGTSSTCTSASPTRTRTKVPMRIYPAVHYTMGGLWVDYDLMSTVPGLFVLGEANFSDHGANRLGASALMQGLADGYFVIRYTLGNYLADLLGTGPVPTDDPAFAQAEHDGRRPGAAAPVDRRHPLRRPLPPRAGQDRVGLLRHGPRPGGPREGARRDPGAARGVLEGRPGPRRRRRSTSRSRRPAGSPTSSSWPS